MFYVLIFFVDVGMEVKGSTYCFLFHVICVPEKSHLLLLIDSIFLYFVEDFSLVNWRVFFFISSWRDIGNFSLSEIEHHWMLYLFLRLYWLTHSSWNCVESFELIASGCLESTITILLCNNLHLLFLVEEVFDEGLPWRYNMF